MTIEETLTQEGPLSSSEQQELDNWYWSANYHQSAYNQKLRLKVYRRLELERLRT